jgi:enoyl-CoA hydratase/carnithine racemase
VLPTASPTATGGWPRTSASTPTSTPCGTTAQLSCCPRESIFGRWPASSAMETAQRRCASTPHGQRADQRAAAVIPGGAVGGGRRAAQCCPARAADVADDALLLPRDRRDLAQGSARLLPDLRAPTHAAVLTTRQPVATSIADKIGAAHEPGETRRDPAASEWPPTSLVYAATHTHASAARTRKNR